MSRRRSERRGRSDSWEGATWEGSRQLLLEGTVSATPAERLEWLEEMIHLAFATGALPRTVKASVKTSQGR